MASIKVGSKSYPAHRNSYIPKGSRSTTHPATQDGEEVGVEVTQGTHSGKQYCYSYFVVDGQVYYVKGHLGGVTFEVTADEVIEPGHGFE